jgi:hypothetical protein
MAGQSSSRKTCSGEVRPVSFTVNELTAWNSEQLDSSQRFPETATHTLARPIAACMAAGDEQSAGGLY